MVYMRTYIHKHTHKYTHTSIVTDTLFRLMHVKLVMSLSLGGKVCQYNACGQRTYVRLNSHEFGVLCVKLRASSDDAT